jgi:hypothetical protein
MAPSEEVNDATGEAPARAKGQKPTTLEQRIADLRAVEATPSPQDQARAERERLETQLAEQRHVAAKADAASRMVAIARAHGSLRTEYLQDEERVQRAVAELGAAVVTINQRYERLLTLDLEAHDLHEDFGLPLPKLPSLVPPGETLRVTPGVELWTHNDNRGVRSDHAIRRQHARQTASPGAAPAAVERSGVPDLSKVPASIAIAGQF